MYVRKLYKNKQLTDPGKEWCYKPSGLLIPGVNPFCICWQHCKREYKVVSWEFFKLCQSLSTTTVIMHCVHVGVYSILLLWHVTMALHNVTIQRWTRQCNNCDEWLSTRHNPLTHIELLSMCIKLNTLIWNCLNYSICKELFIPTSSDSYGSFSTWV